MLHREATALRSLFHRLQAAPKESGRAMNGTSETVSLKASLISAFVLTGALSTDVLNNELAHLAKKRQALRKGRT